MVERGLFSDDARVLGLTSEGNKVAWKGYAAVGAAKVALESVSRSIAVEMASLGVRSNIIQAGVRHSRSSYDSRKLSPKGAGSNPQSFQ